jgi:ankyrin repeat protein
MWAIGRGDDGVDLVKNLIAHGADINAKDAHGASAMSYADSNPPKPKILQVLKTDPLVQKGKPAQ